MKKLLTALTLLGAFSAYAQVNLPASEAYPFPEKLSDVSDKTYKSKSRGEVTNQLLLLSGVRGPVVLRLCISKPYSGSALLDSMVSAKIGKKVILDTETMDQHDDSAPRSQDFVLCKDTEFSSYKELDDKKLSLVAISGSREFYVEVFPKERPQLSWPKMIRTTNDGQAYIVLDLHHPTK